MLAGVDALKIDDEIAGDPRFDIILLDDLNVEFAVEVSDVNHLAGWTKGGSNPVDHD